MAFPYWCSPMVEYRVSGGNWENSTRGRPFPSVLGAARPRTGPHVVEHRANVGKRIDQEWHGVGVDCTRVEPENVVLLRRVFPDRVGGKRADVHGRQRVGRPPQGRQPEPDHLPVCRQPVHVIGLLPRRDLGWNQPYAEEAARVPPQTVAQVGVVFEGPAADLHQHRPDRPGSLPSSPAASPPAPGGRRGVLSPAWRGNSCESLANTCA